jgi:glycosyltransferase involved in cell wall biosynthesis
VSVSPRVVLGMTLHNNAQHLPGALDSLLAQTYADFRLFLLDDASNDETETVARRYVQRDPRLQYARHAQRKAMIATWRDVAESATTACPSAEYFAWVSDHDLWRPEWLERLVGTLDADPGAVVAYPITQRMTPQGVEIDKGPRLFETAASATTRDRWNAFCRSVGAGDMVYGLIRTDALRRAGIFRTVLRPDRLLLAELTLQGRVRQVPEALWCRRQGSATSVARQRTTLLPPGEAPWWFFIAPWLQHSVVLWRQYAGAGSPELGLTRSDWLAMLLRYQVLYLWKGFRKTDLAHTIERGAGRVWWCRKVVAHAVRWSVYHALVGGRLLWGRVRRASRRAVYEVLMLTHRLGLRGRREAP